MKSLMTLVCGLAAVLLIGLAATGGFSAPTAESTATWPALKLVDQNILVSQPTSITHAGDGSQRLFITEKTGRIRIVRDGALLAVPFLDLGGGISTNQEQGLLGLAFPPDFAQSQQFYVHYNNPIGDSVIARYQVSTSNPDLADPATGQVILTVDQTTPIHMGGQMAFGPDGYLYIGLGDGGPGGDPYGRAQSPKALQGKILRIDPQPAGSTPPSSIPEAAHRLFFPVAPGGSPEGYVIPESNPYVDAVGYRGEIWALGLRNPWKFSFDGLTGDLFIGDVGQFAYEEVNFQPAASPGGENYGWNILEASYCYADPSCSAEGTVLPILEYDHSRSDCAVIGGYVYRGQSYPSMQEIYYLADWCSGRIWGLQQQGQSWDSSELLDTTLAVSTMGEDEAGNIYLADHYTGQLYLLAEAS